MGLLDSLFDQNTYGGQGGGLLDFLRTSQMQQNNYQPSAGFPAENNQPSPLDNAQWPAGPVGAPSQQAGPIAVGNYQMPRIGSAQAFTPDPSAIPQNAQPAQGQLPAQQPTPQMQQASPGGLSAGLSGFIGNLHTGPLGAIMGGLAGASGLRDPATQQQLRAQNLTLRALIQKGVDPVTAQAAISNPELLKTIITQTYGPQTVTALGNGYVADKNGNIKRAYQPDDKTPNSALEYNFYKSKLPAGESPVTYQKWLATKNTDPSKPYILGRGGEIVQNGPDGKPVILHKNDATEAEATLDDKTVTAMAAQYLAGDKSVMQNLGRGAQGAANIVKLRGEIYHQAGEQGLNSKDIVNNFNEQAGNLAGQRSIGTRAANISLAANEANNMIPIALKASDAVPRGEWMPWNKMVQAYQTGSSSPELARFVAATNSLVNSYVRAVSPSGVPTDSMREHAYSMLNSAQSAKAYKAVTDIMQDEMKAAMEAPGQVRKELRHEEKPAETPSGAPKAGAYMWMPGKGLVPKE